VLIHQPARPNSVILPSDAARHIHEFLPGQSYRAMGPRLLGQIGGIGIEVLSFDLAQRKARLNIQTLSVRPPLFEENPRHGLGPDGMLIAFVNGRFVRVPIPDPRVIDIGELGLDLPTLDLSEALQNGLARPGG
jgi:hypothetical protein